MTFALDLFAGSGWGVACDALGIEEFGVENMTAACQTREAAGFTTVGSDVWEYEAPWHGEFDGLIASPPCQTFSLAGKGKGRQALDDVLLAVGSEAYQTKAGLRLAAEQFGDDRTALVLMPMHFWHVMRPEWVVWEQVPTVLPVWQACAEKMREAGYSVWTGNLQAEMYGVPQTRKRAFLIASRIHEVSPPVPTHSRYYPRDPTRLDDGVESWVSMATALDWGLVKRPSPTITGGGTETGGAEPIAHWDRYYRSTTMANSALRQGTEPAPTIAFGHDAASAHWMFKRPATTIVGTFKPEIVAAPGYRTTVSRQNAPNSVRVTVEEAGILQSFPADFPWQGAKTRQFLQVGNAVPPLLAEAVLRQVLINNDGSVQV